MIEKSSDRTKIGSLVPQVIDAIRSVVGNGPVALSEPIFQGNEWNYVKECLDSTFVASEGRFVDCFEADLAAYTGAGYAITVVNGTAGLHIALKLTGVKPGDEVLVPALTFVATANAVTYCGAQPHFVDVETQSLGIDVTKLRYYLQEHTEQRNNQCINRSSGHRIQAIVPMHTFGHPADLDALLAIAHDYSLALVEDAAESIGSTYHGRHTGTFGLFGVLSFNGNKTITTGGGGAILTNDRTLAAQVKFLTTTAKSAHPWEYRHDQIGYNYRLPNINAAIGVAQLEQLPSILESKRRLFNQYDQAFQEVTGATLIKEPSGSRSNYWLQTLLLSPEQVKQRDTILQKTNDLGLMTRPVWVPLHQLSPYRSAPRMDLSQAELLADGLLNLPSSRPLS